MCARCRCATVAPTALCVCELPVHSLTRSNHTRGEFLRRESPSSLHRHSWPQHVRRLPRVAGAQSAQCCARRAAPRSVLELFQEGDAGKQDPIIAEFLGSKEARGLRTARRAQRAVTDPLRCPARRKSCWPACRSTHSPPTSSSIQTRTRAPESWYVACTHTGAMVSRVPPARLPACPCARLQAEKLRDLIQEQAKSEVTIFLVENRGVLRARWLTGTTDARAPPARRHPATGRRREESVRAMRMRMPLPRPALLVVDAHAALRTAGPGKKSCPQRSTAATAGCSRCA